MPERKTPLITGHYYHVFNKGVNGKEIFCNPRHYQRMIDCLWLYRYLNHPLRLSYLLRLGIKHRHKIKQDLKNEDKLVEIIAYCLMPNHFHLLLKQTVDEGISNFLHNIQNSYARYHNIEQARSGPLFQNRFKAVLLKSEEQFTHVSRYIHLNPFSSFVVKDLKKLKKYQWSSLHEYLSQKENVCSVCSIKMLSDIFGTSSRHWNFIFDHADHQRKLEEIKHLTLEI